MIQPPANISVAFSATTGKDMVGIIVEDQLVGKVQPLQFQRQMKALLGFDATIAGAM